MIRTDRLLALALMLALPAAWGASLPAYYPDPLPKAATIDRVDVSHRQVVMNDSLYQLSDRVVVHTQNQQFAPLSTLAKGDRAAFRFVYGAGGHKMLTEIWILPSGYGRSEE